MSQASTATANGGNGGFSALKSRNYQLFFVGQFISVTGTWMQTLAQAWLVLALTKSPLKLALVNVCQFAPVLVLGLFAGVIADRFPKRNVLIITQSFACVLAAVLAILDRTGNVRLWQVYVLALGLGIVNAFDMPTRQAFVGEMVPPEDLMSAIALNSSLFNMGRLLGPALAGLVLASLGTAACFGLNSLSYLAVIAALAAMRIAEQPAKKHARGLTEIREGLAYVRQTPLVLGTIVFVGLVATFGLNFNVWIPLLARFEFDTGARGFGILMSALGLGSLVGALGLAARGRIPRPMAILGTAALLGVAELCLVLAGHLDAPLAVALGILPIMGLAMTTTMAMANTTVQSQTPQHLKGRVMSVYMTVFAGTAPLGALVAGSVADRFGTLTSIAIGATVTLVTVGVLASILRRYQGSQPVPAPTAAPEA